MPDGTHLFLARVNVDAGGSDPRGCSGVLIDPRWVVTARDCFAAAGAPPAFGPPPRSTTVTLGRTTAKPEGHVTHVTQLVPHAERNVVLARLAFPAPDVTPVAIGRTAPAIGEVLRLGGYGRTATEWVPQYPHAADFEVTAVQAGTADIQVTEPERTDPCLGDAGGPALRQVGDRVEVVAIAHTSWQHGCLGSTETRQGASLTRLDDIADWVRQGIADVSVFGVAADRRLTYTAIDSASGDRIAATVTSTAALPFTPKAFTVLNYNTLLLTDGSRLYRIDVQSTNPLSFQLVDLNMAGWSHEVLAYDGFGSLFGLAAGSLRRYTVTSAKPTSAYITNYTVVGASGFGSFSTLTAIGPNWVMGSTGGELVAYKIDVSQEQKWRRFSLAASGWTGTHLLSPGGGLIYSRTSAGALLRYRDAAPLDGSGTDITAYPNDPVDTSGWNQTHLSALPFDSFPRSPVDVSVFGVTGDNRLTYTAIDSVTGDRRGTTVTSTAALPFTPKAFTVLNFDTALVTNGSRLHRIDVLSTNPLLFEVVDLNQAGWSHDLLAYDGFGSLFGIANGALRRYTVTSPKPTSAQITNNTVIATEGFSLRTLTGFASNWIMGTTGGGELVAYQIDVTATPKWRRMSLAASGWTGTHLLTPGAGLIYSRTSAGALLRYRDAAPFNGSGTDITAFPDDPVDASGWNQVLLSAQPFSPA